MSFLQGLQRKRPPPRYEVSFRPRGKVRIPIFASGLEWVEQVLFADPHAPLQLWTPIPYIAGYSYQREIDTRTLEEMVSWEKESEPSARSFGLIGA